MENEQLLEYIGKTKTNNLIEQINKEYFENFRKQFPNFYSSPEIAKASSLVTVTKENEIRSIGMSCMNDLLSDNYGIYLMSLYGGNLNIETLQDITNTGESVKFMGTGTMFNSTFVAVGTQIQIGKGTSTPTRQDFNIESPFTTAPESTIKNTANGGWNSGLGQVLASMIPFGAGGSGDISETIFVQVMNITTNVQKKFLMSRDLISPISNFILGQTINVNYTFAFS